MSPSTVITLACSVFILTNAVVVYRMSHLRDTVQRRTFWSLVSIAILLAGLALYYDGRTDW